MKPARGMLIGPGDPVGGVLRVPGDKSISHRAVLLGALAGGVSEVHGFLESEDCRATAAAVQALGAGVERSGGALRIRGAAGRLAPPRADVDLGNSGTGLRLLAGVVAGQRLDCVLTGDASLRSRPMRRIAEPLIRMGAEVELLGRNGCAPVRIRGGVLQAMEYRLPVASAQVKSCILLAGLQARGETVVYEPGPTRDHTERMLRAMGCAIRVDGLRIAAQPVEFGRVAGRTWRVPGDFSSAAFWLTAAAAVAGAEVRIEDVGLNPRRTALLDVLERMGADVETTCQTGMDWEPAGSIRMSGGSLHGTEIGGLEIPNLIDELPLAAVAGALAEGVTRIRDAGELRVKESDRIAAMAEGLRRMGIRVDERSDGMDVYGGRPRGGVTVDSGGDHRVAMALSVLALFADREVNVWDVDCVDTSYPGFWRDLEALTGRRARETPGPGAPAGGGR